MKKLNIIIIIIITLLLSSCVDDITESSLVGNENYNLEPLLTVEQPISSPSQVDTTEGLETVIVNVDEIDWKVAYESTQYSILYRDAPDEMIFPLYGFSVEGNCTCTIDAKIRYMYVVFFNEEYYDIIDFHQKYNNLSCDFLDELKIEYYSCESD
jgi:hypothetical protein